RAEVRVVLGGDECAVKLAVPVWRSAEQPLEIGADFERARCVAGVLQAQQPDFTRRILRHEIGNCAANARALPFDDGVSEAVANAIVFECRAARLPRDRPELARIRVAQIEILAPLVAD